MMEQFATANSEQLKRLLEGAGSGDRAVVAEILDAKCDVNVVDAEGWSPLILASKVVSAPPLV